jgi:hypothetical protein
MQNHNQPHPQLCKQAFAPQASAGYTPPHLRPTATFETAFPELSKPVSEVKKGTNWSVISDKLKGISQPPELAPIESDEPPTYAELLTGIKVVDVSNDPYYAYEALEKHPPSARWQYLEKRRLLEQRNLQQNRFIFTEDLIAQQEAAAAAAEDNTSVEDEPTSDTDENSCEFDTEYV